MNSRFSGRSGFGSWFGKVPSGLEVAADDVELREALEHGRQHRAGHAVRGVDDDLQRPDRGHVHEGQHPFDVRRPDVVLQDPAR